MPAFRRLATALALLLAPLPASFAEEPPAPAGEPAGNAVELNRLNAKKEAPWTHHIYQGRIDLDPKASYVIAFSACASKELYLDLFTKNDEPPWAFFGLRKQLLLNTAWERHEIVFSAERAIPRYSRLIFGFATADAAAIWIADVSLRKLADGRPDGPNLVRNPRFQQTLAHWSVEGRDTGSEEFTVDVVPVALLNRSAAEVP